jgi:MerR family transcriptional regulator, light-induced transcriptional regulator
MTTTLLSTRDVARLLNVTETTIKRWADDGEIPCIKTLGGHRKYSSQEVIRFSELHGIPITGFTGLNGGKNSDRIAFAIQTRNMDALSSELFSVSQRHDPGQVFDFLSLLVTHQIPVLTIADEIVRPALVRVGEKWEKGEISIEQEHMISESIVRAISRLAPELNHKKQNGLKALCACAEGEQHSIGVRWLSASLESDGWNVIDVGANTPFHGLASLVASARPDILCVSVMKMRDDPAWRARFRALGESASRTGTTFIVGGASIPASAAAEIACDHVANSITDGLSYIRERFHLKPGPRKKSHD